MTRGQLPISQNDPQYRKLVSKGKLDVATAGHTHATPPDHNHTVSAGDGGVLTNPELDGYEELAEIATPSNPAANKLRVYAKDVAGVTKLHTLDSAGTETALGAGGGGGGDRIQDADNDTFIDAEAGADPDFHTAGIPATSAIFLKFLKGAETEPRVQVQDDGLAFGSGSAAPDAWLRFITSKVVGLHGTAASSGQALQFRRMSPVASTPANEDLVLYNKLFGSSYKLFVKDQVGIEYGPLGGKEQATVFGRGPSGGIEPPGSTTWSDSVWGTLAPSGLWTPSGSMSVGDDIAVARGRYIQAATGIVSGNDAGIESAQRFWGYKGDALLVRLRAAGNDDSGTANAAVDTTPADSGTADAAVTTTNTTLTDTRNSFAGMVGAIITCNGKTMTVTSISTTTNPNDTVNGAAWSGGGNPGNGNAWSLTATLGDTREAWVTDEWVGAVVTCNGKTMTVTNNTATRLHGTAGWSGGGDPGDGLAWGITGGTTFQRIFVGFAGQSLATMVGADNPGTNHLGLQFSTPRGDTNWQLVERGSSATQVVTNTGVAFSNAPVYVQVLNSSSLVQIVLFDKDFVPVYTRTVGILTKPSSSTTLAIIIGIETEAATARKLQWYHVSQHAREG